MKNQRKRHLLMRKEATTTAAPIFVREYLPFRCNQRWSILHAGLLRMSVIFPNGTALRQIANQMPNHSKLCNRSVTGGEKNVLSSRKGNIGLQTIQHVGAERVADVICHNVSRSPAGQPIDQSDFLKQKNPS
ncbi:hypothetical protein ZHAS_00015252 [Anopheles sinensis]|uniref:Uncharacterized protein n=1 Tax=Anopheles sinensis TaxID=74873 RepID=A0A084WAI3_ANOSI|nr:hypothetical protein ZHAS_00015252 [Anopheles sinensis]